MNEDAYDLREMMAFKADRSGLIIPGRFVKPLPTCIDFFCGCGGFSLGVTQAGFHVVAAVDNDIACAVTYMVNLGSSPCQFHFTDEEDEAKLELYIKRLAKGGEMPLSGSGWISHYPEIPGTGHYWLGDVRKLTGAEILDAVGMKRGEVDLVVGGPPCQGFSMAGKREVMDPRNSLVFEYARLVCEISPKAFMVENVPGLLSMSTSDGIPVIDAFARIMEDGGFGTYEAVKKVLLNTAGCGMALKPANKALDSSDDDTYAETEEPALALF